MRVASGDGTYRGLHSPTLGDYMTYGMGSLANLQWKTSRLVLTILSPPSMKSFEVVQHLQISITAAKAKLATQAYE